MLGDAPRYDELMLLYRNFSDTELRNLAREMGDLTESAQQVLKVELARRNLDLNMDLSAEPESASAPLPELVPAADPLLQQHEQPLMDEETALGLASAEFVEPTCPQCGETDPLLEGVDPVNQWRCESCGHTWSDLA
ncbi:MAG: hypothetical protein KGK08_10210 [Acidobacteriota bacterium]|nr:hypothetical protein [Acidobacteriota bacterium]